MTDIILSTQNGEPVASSRQIAENFEKRHDHVMRDIDTFKKDVPNFGEMFFEAEAPDSYGRPQRTYLMNRDGFSLLVMGFTGKAALENTMTVDYNQQRVLRKSISRSVIGALGDEKAPAYIDNHVRSKVYSECNHDVQDWFRVNSVGNIPRKRFDEAVEYIQRWKPSTNTVMLIQQTNGQTSLFDRACAPSGRLIDSEVSTRG